MTDVVKKPATVEDALSVTTVLHSLAEVANDDAAGVSRNSKRVLLIGRPRSVRGWDLRWLEQSGFELNIVTEPEHALATIRTLEPHSIVVEFAVKAADGRFMIDVLSNADEVDVPVFVLANSRSDTKRALDAGAFDVARKPYDWRLLSRRLRLAVREHHQHRELLAARGSLQSAVSLVEQVREQKRSSESFEPVTGLPNRAKFDELIRRSARSIANNDNVLICMVVGLSRFNLITEALGVDVSDRIASTTATILRECLQHVADQIPLAQGLRTASLARVGPGRFGVMMTASPDAVELDELRRLIIDRLSIPAIIDGQSVYLSPCIGAAVYPRDLGDHSQLTIKSESAMREARGRGLPFLSHSVRIDEELARRLDIENRLHTALDKSELQVAYQPLVDVVSDRIVGCEALLRWPQADGSFVSPSEFVPIAESSGMMIRIGEFVLDTACRQLAQWREEGIDDVRMSVNVSKCQLQHESLPAIVRRCIREYGIDPKMLDLELSERGTLSPESGIHSRLVSLKEIGVSLSVDDFGTGEAAIAYLKDLPVDVLKIDRSYIMELTPEDAESTMTSAMVALGQKLNLTIVAEGVESHEQLKALRVMGCDQYQGFFRSPAVSPDELKELVRKSH